MQTLNIDYLDLWHALMFSNSSKKLGLITTLSQLPVVFAFIKSRLSIRHPCLVESPGLTIKSLSLGVSELLLGKGGWIISRSWTSLLILFPALDELGDWGRFSAGLSPDASWGEFVIVGGSSSTNLGEQKWTSKLLDVFLQLRGRDCLVEASPWDKGEGVLALFGSPSENLTFFINILVFLVKVLQRAPLMVTRF